MVIINETYGANGRKLFELEELETGQRSSWSPPRNMERAQYREALIQVGKRLEAVAKQNVVDFSIPETAIEEEPTAETLFGIYVTKVYLPRRAPKLAERTLSIWKDFLRLRILPAFGHIAIGAITSGRLMDFFTGMHKEGLSYHTVERYDSFLRVVFKKAALTGVISQNPMEMVERPTPRKDELICTSVEACTADEIARLMEIMEKEPLKWRVIIRLLIETGMRVGECMALQWMNINWKTNAITICATLGYTPEKGIYLTTPKNRKARTVYVSDEMMILLLLYSIENSRGVNSNFLFHQKNSPEPMYPYSPTRYLAKLSVRYDIPRIHPHKLRHSYASIALTHGADLCSVSENLGHCNSSVTLNFYTNANEKSKRLASNICMNAVKEAALTA